MTLSDRILDFVGLVAADIKSITSRVGTLESAPPSAGVQQVFVQNAAPSVTAGTQYIWVQTGLGDSSNEVTFWIEDGL